MGLEVRKWLLGVVGSALGIGLIVVWVRLVQLQVFQAPQLRQAAQRQGYVRLHLLATRGEITDRWGNIIAMSVEAPSYGVDPAAVRCVECLCRAARAVLGVDEQECQRLITSSRGRFLWLRRGVWGRETKGLDTLEEPGLIRLRERVRVYIPEGLFLPALGSVGVDQQGLSGLELAYDSVLRMEPMTVLMRRDARGWLFPTVEHVLESPRRPPVLHTTLDGLLQRILTYELARGVQQVQAAGGVGIALEPATGAIRAFVAVPSPPRGSAHAPLVSQVYEPGSVFKPIIAAIALELGVVRLNDTLSGHNGQWIIGTHRVVDEHPLGRATLREALTFSSNVVFAELATRIPRMRLYQYLRDFGFGAPVESGLPGEAAGIMPEPEEIDSTTVAFWGFGYGIAVTPLQLACAYAAIANDGVFVRPRLVEAIGGENGGYRLFPQPIRRVVSAATARWLRHVLCSVVEEGTGRLARLPGVSIAGKTGTAQQTVNGRYSREAHTASFVAMVPAERPQLVLLVMVVRPQGTISGGEVAAPIVRRVLQRMAAHPVLGTYLGIGTASEKRSS